MMKGTKDQTPWREASFLIDLLLDDAVDYGFHSRAGLSIAELQKRCCECFSGVTTCLVEGCWIDPRTKELVQDNSLEVRIAASWHAFNERNLRELAFELAKGQETVYVKWADGTVNVLEIPKGEE